MADAKQKEGANQDQSMEEILQSIRRIIAEEGDADPKDSKEEIMTPPKGSDVLELTDMVNDDGSVININSQKEEPVTVEKASVPEASVERPKKDSDVLSTIDKALGASTPDTGEGLVSSETIAASADVLKSLAGLPQTAARPAASTTPSPVFRSGTTVEDLVLETLRPMLKSWLDANLTLVVERIVEREVKKISSRFDS